MITNLGTLTLGSCAPGALAIQTAGLTGINLALPDLLARLAALQAFVPQPISFAVMLTLAEQTLQGVQLAISAGLPVPDISAQMAIVAAIIAALEQALAQIQQQVSFIESFSAYFATGGIQALRYSGAANSCGTELNGAVIDGAPCEALILIARTPEAQAALDALMVTA